MINLVARVWQCRANCIIVPYGDAHNTIAMRYLKCQAYPKGICDSCAWHLRCVVCMMQLAHSLLPLSLLTLGCNIGSIMRIDNDSDGTCIATYSAMLRLYVGRDNGSAKLIGNCECYGPTIRSSIANYVSNRKSCVSKDDLVGPWYNMNSAIDTIGPIGINVEDHQYMNSNYGSDSQGVSIASDYKLKVSWDTETTNNRLMIIDNRLLQTLGLQMILTLTNGIPIVGCECPEVPNKMFILTSCIINGNVTIIKKFILLDIDLSSQEYPIGIRTFTTRFNVKPQNINIPSRDGTVTLVAVMLIFCSGESFREYKSLTLTCNSLQESLIYNMSISEVNIFWFLIWYLLLGLTCTIVIGQQSQQWKHSHGHIIFIILLISQLIQNNLWYLTLIFQCYQCYNTHTLTCTFNIQVDIYIYIRSLVEDTHYIHMILGYTSYTLHLHMDITFIKTLFLHSISWYWHILELLWLSIYCSVSM